MTILSVLFLFLVCLIMVFQVVPSAIMFIGMVKALLVDNVEGEVK